ncbi:MAG: transposase [Terracidiphilus sp.]|nr:transposase [Terracidiphilus sp.]
MHGAFRRNFFDLMKERHSPIATEAVKRIAAFYKIEKQIKGRPAEERRADATWTPPSPWTLPHAQSRLPAVHG